MIRIPIINKEMNISNERLIIECFKDEEPIKRNHWKPTPTDIVLDIGAQYGVYTILSALSGAYVHAFEPGVFECGYLEKHLQMNQLTNCEIHRMIVHDNSPYPTEHFKEVFQRRYPIRDAYNTVPHSITLDDFAKSCPNITMIKIDVEGTEYHVLNGAQKLLATLHPYLLIEEHSTVYQYPRDIHSQQKIEKLLKDLNYEVKIVPWGGRSYIIASTDAAK